MDGVYENIRTGLAAIAGAVVSLKAFPGETKAQKVGNLLSGAAFAVFGGSGAASYFHIKDIWVHDLYVFTAGLFGLAIYSALIETIKKFDFGAAISLVVGGSISSLASLFKKGGNQ